MISIHTLCEEGDDDEKMLTIEYNGISIHTLCEEGDINKHISRY